MTEEPLQSGPPGAPRWVKVLGLVVLVVVIAFVAFQLIGEGHGPGRHMLGH